MTKMKSKKMTKSTFAIIIMAIAMVAMLAFGGTYAYFTATANGIANATITTATVKLTSDSQWTEQKVQELKDNKYLPGDYIFGTSTKAETITLTNGSNVDTIVFVKFSAVAKIGDIEKVLLVDTTEEEKDAFVVDLTTTGWTPIYAEDDDSKAVIGYAIEVDADDANFEHNAFAFTVRLNENIRENKHQDDTFDSNVYVSGDTTKAPVDIMGATLTVNVEIASIQHNGNFEMNAATLADAFAPVA